MSKPTEFLSDLLKPEVKSAHTFYRMSDGTAVNTEAVNSTITVSAMDGAYAKIVDYRNSVGDTKESLVWNCCKLGTSPHEKTIIRARATDNYCFDFTIQSLPSGIGVFPLVAYPENVKDPLTEAAQAVFKYCMDNNIR